MTGSAEYTAAVPPMAVSQHSPASTSSVSSTGSYGGYTGPAARHTNPPPARTFIPSTPSYPPTYQAEGPGEAPAHRPTSLSCPYPPLITCDSGKPQHMPGGGEPLPGHFIPWEAGDGTSHYTAPPGYSYDAAVPVVVTPPNGISNCDPNHGVTVTMCNNNGQQGEVNSRGQHTVHFHVHQNEAVSLQLGEQVQLIQGPATVRMISTNGHEPPVPLPVQVPPGHFVHQVVDESGVLHHVILSQHPTYGPAPPPANGSGPASWAGQPGGYVDPTGPPPNINVTYPASQPPPTYWNTRNELEPKPSKSKNNRGRGENDRQRYKTKPGSSSPSLSVQSTPPQSPVKPRGGTYARRGSAGSWRGSTHTVDDSEESGIGIEHDEDQEEKQLLLEILSNIRTPTVTEIRARAVLLVWSPPVSESGDPRFDKVPAIPETDLEYEVLMSDKGKEGKYRSIFSGASMECYLTDLRPHTEYHIRVHAVLKRINLKGGASDTVSFQTNACEPDQPAIPKLLNRSKTNIQLRWNPPNDNGAHISHFILECDDGSSSSVQPVAAPGQFTTVYEGRAKTFCVQKLLPSTPYKFRLIAVNEHGKSRPSELACFSTNGSAPTQPLPPSLAETSTSSLRLLWSKRPCDDEFTLQMDDPETGHGFLPQYNGQEVEHTVTGLQRNTSYRFKLRAHNEMGASQYSPDVSFTTKPGRPGPPPKPQTKGRIRPHSFRVVWNAPADSGGSPLTASHLELDDGAGWNSVYSGPDMDFLADHLQPGVQYRVRVAAESVGGVSDYSETCFVTTEPVVPDAPAQPHTKDKPKAMSIHLAWAPPEYDGGANVTEYEVEMTATDNVTRGVYRGRDTECVVASLAPGRIYLFQVRAHNRAGVGAWSMALEVLSGAGPPSRPKEPRVNTRSGTAATVSWDPPINNGAVITTYRLELATPAESAALAESESEDEDEEEVKVDDEEEGAESDNESHYDDESDGSDVECEEGGVDICDTVEQEEEEVSAEEVVECPELEWRVAYQGPALSTELRSLRPATQYHLRLSALNAAGCSDTSCNVSLETPASVPAAPHDLAVLATTASSLTVKWRRPAEHGEPLHHYRVEWGTSDKEVTGHLVAERRRVHLPGLRADTSYSLRVQAVNAMGTGPFTPALRVSTRPLPPAPPRLECANTTHNQLKLRWAEAKVNLGTSYLLEMENARKMWYQVYSGNNHTYKVAKLMENTEYRFRISAITDAGQGPFSTVHTFRTLYTPPPAVKGAPRVSHITEGGCLVQWAGLKSMAAGEQLQYRLQLTRVKDGEVTLYQAHTSVEFRITGLEARADYTVRVAAERRPAGGEASMLGSYSPTTQLATLARAGPMAATASSSPATSKEVAQLASRSSWSDQKWAVIILCGFTLFAVLIAMVIQQLISWGTVSS